ncbi:hypothetical protein X777_12430 [Ooceraea biroi]|uniref:Uncharacterized protein n=1 Tax=Ooceraea biroi TaxID=2015173 RepID=A0A026W1Q2_OOCBI|nr:hypothetical protein X777_12430 [Ooceraea biroi]
MDSRFENAPLQRDHDSVDDFEHLGHDSSPDDRSDHQQQPRLIDAPRVDDLLHIGDSFQESALSSALVADAEEAETRPVPATPPPSAEFDKCEAMAQSSDPFQQLLDPADPKLASMAFVESERFQPPTSAAQFRDDDDDEDDDDDDEMGLQPPLLPVSSAVKADSDFPSSLGARVIDEDSKQPDNKAQPIAEFDDVMAALASTDQGNKQAENESIKPRSVRVDEDLAWNVRSSATPPVPERSPLVDFLASDSAPPREERPSRNIMDDDSWNVVEKPDVKGREQFEPPTKPLPPLPKEAELYQESARPSKHDPSKDLLIAEAVKEPPQRSPEREQKTAGPREEKSREPNYSCPRPSERHVAGKKEEIEIAPKQIFRDMGLGMYDKIVIYIFCFSAGKPLRPSLRARG